MCQLVGVERGNRLTGVRRVWGLDVAPLYLLVAENAEVTLPLADRELGRIWNHMPGRLETWQGEIDEYKEENRNSQGTLPRAD
jgi:hypothetical protein